MSISRRQKQILDLLEERGFLTVEAMAELTFTSQSSIRRDLATLHNLSLIKRTHGGASLLREINQAVPLNSRMTQNIAEKRRISKIAATLLEDGQSVMLDGSSTAGFLIPHIAKHLTGNRTAPTLLVSSLVGAILVVASDLLGRILLSPTEIPVGILMALIGVPFFFVLLIRKRAPYA